MRLYPAIDMIDGKCVRLVQGDYSQKTTFAEDPLAVAMRWQEAGARFIHLVDLDGARSGDMPNFDCITGIAKTLDIPIEVGGGIRDMKAVEQYLEHGVNRVIIGTSALRNLNLSRRQLRSTAAVLWWELMRRMAWPQSAAGRK